MNSIKFVPILCNSVAMKEHGWNGVNGRMPVLIF